MGTLKDEAKEHVQSKTKNISELSTVSVDLDIQDGEGMDSDGNQFKYKYIEVEGEQYRVPGIVLGQVKDILEENPNLKTFKVKRTGEGLKTRYTVIPLS